MGLLTGEVLSAYAVNQTKQQLFLQKNGFGLFLDCKRVKDGELRGGKWERIVFRLRKKAVMKNITDHKDGCSLLTVRED